VQIQGIKMLNLIGSLCCVAFMNTIGTVAAARRQKLALSIGPT
jgi:hypothetical protein